MNCNIVPFMHNLYNALSNKNWIVEDISLAVAVDPIDGGLQEDELFLRITVVARSTLKVVVPFKVKEEDFTDPNLVAFILDYMKPELEKFETEKYPEIYVHPV